MRIAVMGSGGVGGYFGGRLAQAGEDVTFIARGAHLETLRTGGLTVQSRVTGDFHRAVSVTDDPSAIGPVDLVLLCVKTYDLDAAATRLAPLVGPDTMVLPLQNGIEASERLARVLGPAPVLGGVAYVIATRVSPGVIVHLGLSRIVLGEYPSGTSARAERVRDVLQRAGVTAELHPDIRVPLWEKLVVLAASGGAMAMTRLPIGPIRDCPETSALLRAVIDEAVAVGRSLGIPLPADCVDRHWTVLQGLDRSARGSMSHDILAGRRLEVEALNGAVVRLGRQAGVATPLNSAVYAALKPYAEGAPAS
jgi:2-dehydropantoate 2-reductase